jgi:hypothetical protein
MSTPTEDVKVFIRLYSTGVKHNGRTVLEVPLKNNTFLGSPDQPLCSLGWAVIQELVQMTRYSSTEAGTADVDRLIKFLTELKTKEMNLSSGK